MIEWNYISEIEKSNGYEDVIEELKSFKKEDYMLLPSEEERNKMIDEIFNIYRLKNIFPITYYNDDGILKEINSCIDKNVKWDKFDNILDFKFNQGQSLCRFLFPNMQDVVVKNVVNNSPYYKFHDDLKLKKAIKFCLEHKTVKNPVIPSAIKDGLEMLGGNVATNFKSMNAKALYERYTPKDGIIYDFSCGYGGRMLGALTSNNNYKYFGVEPNTETFNNLNRLGKYIEKAKKKENIFKIYKQGSEDFRLNKSEYIDFAFSSPPYFNLEVYSNEETQSYIKFPTIEEWLEGYVRETIKNIYFMLKKDRYYAVNIADFKIGSKTVEFVSEWIRISEEEGFKFSEQIHMKLQNRRGTGNGENVRSKREGIFVFKK